MGVVYGGTDQPVALMLAEHTAEVLASMGFLLYRPEDGWGPTLVIGAP